MNIEVRNDSVVISGYVNAVERWSKPLRANLRGMMLRFIEKIKAGAFKTALKRNDNVKVLLNHNPDRELANTKDGTAILEEDNIGLRAEVTITDPEVVEKARNHKLVGWSFGFYSNSDEVSHEATIATRTVSDMDLLEVSILDDTKSPAYYGTSIETRSDDGAVMEIRENVGEEGLNIDELADLVANRVIEKLTAKEATERAEEPPEVSEEAEATEENSATEATEERAIDYSAFEERLAKIKVSPNNENCANKGE
jgi:HK97 family phage prohead protease